MESIRSLRGISYDSINTAFQEAFSDYAIRLSKAELENMLLRRGFDPNFSFAVFEGDKIVAFTLNGMGTFRGKRTVYDTGTGTLPEYRGRGLAAKIFEHSVPILKEAGFTHYLLEVLQNNKAAVHIYKKLGFRISREFNFFLQKQDLVKFELNNRNPEYKIREIDLSHSHTWSLFHDYVPSWQNSLESIERVPDTFKYLGAFYKDMLVAYCVLEPSTGDITSMAVDWRHRRKGVGSALLQDILKYNLVTSVKVINSASDCLSMTGFLFSHGIPMVGRQYEMILEL